jgi:membrane protease YdiL (CAAX protease family)
LLGAVLLPAAFAAKASLRGTLEELTLRWPGRKEVSFALGVEILLFPTLCVATYITKFALTLFGSNFDGTQAAIKQALESSPAGFFALLASSVIIAPVVEELAYRVAVFGCLRSFAGTLPALLATSALFSATHYSPLQAPALFLLGVVLQCLCLHFKSVVPAILLHSLHNLLSMALLFGSA